MTAPTLVALFEAYDRVLTHAADAERDLNAAVWALKREGPTLDEAWEEAESVLPEGWLIALAQRPVDLNPDYLVQAIGRNRDLPLGLVG